MKDLVGDAVPSAKPSPGRASHALQELVDVGRLRSQPGQVGLVRPQPVDPEREGLGDIDAMPGVRRAGGPHLAYARHGVDVTEAFALGVDSLRAHEAYLTGLGPKAPDVDEFLEGMARPAGTRLGARYGVAYEVFHFDLM